MVRKSYESQAGHQGGEPGKSEPQDERAANSVLAPIDERATALNFLSAELGHELSHTWTFLRYLADSLEGEYPNETAMSEIRGMAQRESDRVQQLLRHLRRFRLAPPFLADMELLPIVERSISHVASDAAVDVDVAPHWRIRSDAAVLEVALRHLLLHGISNCSADCGLAVHASTEQAGNDAVVQIDIIDGGPPLAEASASALFNVWDMLPFDGPAFHRAIAFWRLRSIGETLDYQRTAAGNRFRISLPAPRGDRR
jgi:signal transduction histidine kinase